MATNQTKKRRRLPKRPRYSLCLTPRQEQRWEKLGKLERARFAKRMRDSFNAALDANDAEHAAQVAQWQAQHPGETPVRLA